MDKTIIEKIYNDVFLYIQHSNIDLFLCGGASNKSYISNRDELRKRLEKRIQNWSNKRNWKKQRSCCDIQKRQWERLHRRRDIQIIIILQRHLNAWLKWHLASTAKSMDCKKSQFLAEKWKSNQITIQKMKKYILKSWGKCII